jgi:ubiquitin C-terminal hydrolase
MCVMTKKYKNKAKQSQSMSPPNKSARQVSPQPFQRSPGSSSDSTPNSNLGTLSLSNVREGQLLVPKGLPNLGNTCFFNSAMQCLLNTHPLKFYTEAVGKEFELCIPECSPTVYDKELKLQEAKIAIEFNKKMVFVSVFKNFLTEFYSDRSPNPRPVFEQVSQRNPRFRGWQQQDSHEALRHLIDGVRQEELKTIEFAVMHYLQNQGITEDLNLTKRACMNFAKPVLDRVFAGSLLQTVTCNECDHESVRFEPFLDLSLSIPKNTALKPPKKDLFGKNKKQSVPSVKVDRTIEAALEQFTRVERLDGDNAYECEKCCVPINKEARKREKTVVADKKYFIHLLPPVLTLHLKRFEKSQSFGRVYTSKVNAHVEFPLILDVLPYCSNVSEPINDGQKKVLYSLYGIVCHSGSLSGGHYVAYVRSRKPIDQIETFFKQASFFDASSLGDYFKYQNVQSESALKNHINTEASSEENAIKSLSTHSWYYCSDSYIQQVSEDKVLNAEAFMLFYERFY